jgi:general secretion pathway protein G
MRLSGRTSFPQGFSLVELLAVVAIVSLLASIAFPLAELAKRRGQEEELRRALRDIRSAIDEYKRLVDSGRIERPAGASGYPPNLEVLVDGVPDAQSPMRSKIYLLRRLPRDPLAEPRVGASHSWGLRSYESSAAEPRSGSDVFDVYSTAPGTGLDGTPYKQW